MNHTEKSRKVSRLLSKPWVAKSNGTVQFKWATLTTWLGVAAIGAWLSTTAALYWFIKHHTSYSGVRFVHVVGLPFTLESYRQAKGEFLLEQGVEAAKENRWRDAFDLLQAGLPAQPENEEARLLLARIYLMAQRPEQAKTVFLDGLTFRTKNQGEYIRTVLNFLFSQQADSTVIEVADNILARTDLPENIRHTLLSARMFAYYNRDKFSEAQKSIKGTPLENSAQAKFIEIRIDWERGLRESALLSLRALQTNHPADEEIYRALQVFLREQDLRDEARRLALGQQLAFPAKPDAHLDYIRLCAEDQMEARRAESIEDFLRAFGQDVPALLRLQSLAAQFGWSDLAWRITSRIPADKIRDQNSAAALAIEADLKRKDYLEAGQHAAEWLKNHSELLPLERAMFTGLEGLAYYGRGGDAEGETRLEQVLTSGIVAATTLTALGQHLQTMGKVEMSKRLLARAIEIDPLNTSALVALLQLKLETSEIDQSLNLVERLPLVRKPSPQLMRDILTALRSDRYLYVSNRERAIRSLDQRLRLVGHD